MRIYTSWGAGFVRRNWTHMVFDDNRISFHLQTLLDTLNFRDCPYPRLGNSRIGYKYLRRDRKMSTFAPNVDPAKPWHGWDPILNNFRLKDLHRQGYVDWPGNQPYPGIEDDFTVQVPNEIIHPSYPQIPDHPVFAKERWVGINDNDWELIRPAVRLVSCLLTEPYVQSIFNGLLRRTPERIYNQRAMDRYNANPNNREKVNKLYRFRAISHGADAPNFARSRRTWRMLYQLNRCLDWQFSPLPGAWGQTISAGPPGLIRDRTLGSSVLISQEILDVLRGDASSKAFPHAATFDENVARTRTQFFLASILLHEFCHSVWRATHEHLPNIAISTETWHEPFYLNDRISELGWAIEKLIFRGVPYISGWNPMHAALPYGLLLRTFPGNLRARDLHGNAIELGSPAKYGTGNYIWTTIAVKDIHKFFTKRFWHMEVAVRGARALHLEWRVVVSLPPDNPPPLDPGESPTLMPIDPRDPEPMILSNEQFEAIGFKDYDYETPPEDGA